MGISLHFGLLCSYFSNQTTLLLVAFETFHVTYYISGHTLEKQGMRVAWIKKG